MPQPAPTANGTTDAGVVMMQVMYLRPVHAADSTAATCFPPGQLLHVRASAKKNSPAVQFEQTSTCIREYLPDAMLSSPQSAIALETVELASLLNVHAN